MTIITDAKLKLAEENNLEILGQPVGQHEGNDKYLLYRFKSCLHEQNIDTNLVRLSKFKCRTCEQAKLDNEAEEAGLVMLERAHLGTNALYEFKVCKHQQRIGYSAVKDGVFRCRECYYGDESPESLYQKHASKQGLQFLGKLDDGMGSYKRLGCGHTFDYQISAVTSANKLKHNVNCRHCISDGVDKLLQENNASLISKEGGDIEYKYNSCGHINTQKMHQIKTVGITECLTCKLQDTLDTAKSRGLVPVSLDALNSAGSGEYIFTDCGHTIDITRRNLSLRKDIKCYTCRVENIHAKAKSYGVTIDSFLNSDIRKFYGSFDDCGHTRLFATGDMFRKNKEKLVCAVCRDARHVEEAKLAGLELIGKADNLDPNYRSYKLPCCGNHQDFEVTHIRNKSFLCRHCDESKYDKETDIYIFKIKHENHEWLKMGISIDTEKRLQQYGLPEDSESELIFKKRFETGFEALAIEKRTHTKLKKQKMDLEIMKEKHTKSGYTECYPLSSLNDLINCIEEIDT